MKTSFKKSMKKSVISLIMGSISALLAIAFCFTESPNGGFGEFGTTGIFIGALIAICIEIIMLGDSKAKSRVGMFFHVGAFATTAIALIKMNVICVYTDYYVVNNFGYYDEFSTKVNGVEPFIWLCILFAVRLLAQICFVEIPLFSRVSKKIEK